MEGVKRIEDLDLSIFCTQGTVGVGVIILIFTALCLREEWRSMGLAGLLAGESSSCQFAFSAVCFAENFSPF
jgi:hypothetical protein